MTAVYRGKGGYVSQMKYIKFLNHELTFPIPAGIFNVLQLYANGR